MTVTRTRSRVAIVLIAICSCCAGAFASDDALSRAKDLYLSAAYEDALTVLDGLKSDRTVPDATEVAEYRVFCLLALQRTDDARKAIEDIVTAYPFYVPAEGQASPRIRTVFREVRKGLLPAMVQNSYADAKVAFDRKDPEASALFDRLLTLLADPDLKATPALVDLRIVASGFRDLSKAMVASPPPAPLPLAGSATKSADARPNAAAPSADAPPVSSNVSGKTASPVSPPVAVFQQLPPWLPTRPPDAKQEFNGTLEIMINEQGKVVAATISKSIHPLYDAELLRSARTWKFKPAMKDGRPTEYLKVIDIHLRPIS